MAERGVTAGDLRERVEIQAATVTRGDFGEEILTWATTATVWAQVYEWSGRGAREVMLTDSPTMVVGYEVKVRAGVTVTHKHRLLWRSKVLDIHTVTPLPGQGLIVLRCLEAEN